jgi:hypothetical protein
LILIHSRQAVKIPAFVPISRRLCQHHAIGPSAAGVYWVNGKDWCSRNHRRIGFCCLMRRFSARIYQ